MGVFPPEVMTNTLGLIDMGSTLSTKVKHPVRKFHRRPGRGSGGSADAPSLSGGLRGKGPKAGKPLMWAAVPHVFPTFPEKEVKHQMSTFATV